MFQIQKSALSFFFKSVRARSLQNEIAPRRALENDLTEMSNLDPRWPSLFISRRTVLHRSGARSCHCIGIRLFYMGMGCCYIVLWQLSTEFAANICEEAEKSCMWIFNNIPTTPGIWNCESESVEFQTLKRSFVFIPQRLDVDCFSSSSFFLFSSWRAFACFQEATDDDIVRARYERVERWALFFASSKQ